MPTGYTAAVQDGSMTELKDFVMRCARAMGPLVIMRDAPASALIPERFEANNGYAEHESKRATLRLAELGNMDEHKMTIEAASAYEKQVQECAEYNERIEVQRLRYRKMLEQVIAWRPPTADHADLYNFMCEQLRDSIQWDCEHPMQHPERITVKEWYQQEVKSATEAIERSCQSIDDENGRIGFRNGWIKALRESLE